MYAAAFSMCITPLYFSLRPNYYLYIIRVVPKTPDVLVAFAQLIVPLLIMLFVKMLYEKQKKVIDDLTKKYNVQVKK